MSIQATILTDANTKDDIYRAVITLKDTVKNLGIMSTGGESRRTSAFYRESRGGRGRHGRGGRAGKGRGGRYVGRTGRSGDDRNDRQNYRSENNFIPNDILEVLPIKYRAIMFKGRDVMAEATQIEAGVSIVRRRVITIVDVAMETKDKHRGKSRGNVEIM